MNLANVKPPGFTVHRFDFHKYVTVSSAGVFARPVINPNGAATVIRSVYGIRVMFIKIGRGNSNDFDVPLDRQSWKAVLMRPGDYLYVVCVE